jgi:hypothetical protein
VDLINAALQDFVDGQNPILIFRIDNGSTTPAPSVVDPMQFVWRAWLTIQVVLNQEVNGSGPVLALHSLR